MATASKTQRSAGLLHDLQDYIAEMEQIAEQRREDNLRLKQEKAEALAMKKQQDRPVGSSIEFNSVHGSDLPPKVRALIEDAKVLKTRVKKYKEKSTAHERTITTQQAQVIKLQDRVASLEASLKQCKKNPDQVMNEEEMKAQMASKDAAVQDLEHRLTVVTKSKETDLKKFRHATIAMQKEKEEILQTVEELKLQLEEKDKEARAAALKIRSLQKKLEPVKKPPPPPPEPKPLNESMDGSSTFMTSVPFEGNNNAVLPAISPSKQLEQSIVDDAPAVHLMLCIVAGDAGAAPAPAPAEEGDAEADAEGAGEFPEGADAAAVKIQAAQRGRAARQQVAAMKADKEGAAEGGEEAAAAEGEGEGEAAAAEGDAAAEGEGEAAADGEAAAEGEEGAAPAEGEAAAEEEAPPAEPEKPVEGGRAAESAKGSKKPQPPKGGKPNAKADKGNPRAVKKK